MRCNSAKMGASKPFAMDRWLQLEFEGCVHLASGEEGSADPPRGAPWQLWAAPFSTCPALGSHGVVIDVLAFLAKFTYVNYSSEGYC